MTLPDEFSTYYEELLEGQYDCPDRIVLHAYFGMGQTPGGFRHWWRRWQGGDEKLDNAHIMRAAGDFTRRVRGYAHGHGIPLLGVRAHERKDDYWKDYRPKDPGFTGVFLILIGQAPGPVWRVQRRNGRVSKLYRLKSWPYVNHVYFHIMDPTLGHLIVRMCTYPPFGAQIILNGHNWVECLANSRAVHYNKTDNCFVNGTDLGALDGLTKTVRSRSACGSVVDACDRWVYSSCLSFGLPQPEQERTRFEYQHAVYQLEYSRNLLFKRGKQLDEVFQKVIDRTRSQVDIRRLKSIFGFSHRPHRQTKRGLEAIRPQMTINRPTYHLTVFKVQWNKVILKIYDKGDRILRIEVIAQNAKYLRRGTGIDKWKVLLEEMERMLVEFLGTLQAAHVSFLDSGALDKLGEPSRQGSRRLAGLDMSKPRVRAVAQGLEAVATAPRGFTAAALLRHMQQRQTPLRGYAARQLLYDLAKFKAKGILSHKKRARTYRIRPNALRTLRAYRILREEVLKPVLAGAGHPHVGRPPKNISPIDQHYMALAKELHATLATLGIAA